MEADNALLKKKKKSEVSASVWNFPQGTLRCSSSREPLQQSQNTALHNSYST